MNRRRVLIVDDHIMIRAGLRAMVGDAPDLEVVGEADSGLDAIRAVAKLVPHLVLMDLTLPGMNGIKATAEIKQHHPDVRVLIVTMHDSVE